MSATIFLILKGIATYMLPPRFYNRRLGGADSAQYCYSVFLRHLSLLAEAGGDTDPSRIAELGPGASIGIGLAALIAGAERYDGLDIRSYGIDAPSRALFEELVALFSRRAPIPDDDVFPDVKPRLASYAFPDRVLTGDRLQRSLDPDRIDRIRRALNGDQPTDAPVLRYVAPWTDTSLIESGTLDWIFSQAVMEHVDDLATSYACCYRWLRAGGAMTHQIDFRSHGLAPDWNGHWACSDVTWWLMRGRRPYLINRQPISVHLRLLGQNGFTVVSQQAVTRTDGIARRDLAVRFRDLSDEDLSTAGVFVIAFNSRDE